MAELECAVPRVAIDASVARDFLRPDEGAEAHALARAVFDRARAGVIELRIAPQGHRLDFWDGDLRGDLADMLASQPIAESPQLSILSEETYPSPDLYPGAFVPGLGEAWAEVLDDWRSIPGPGHKPGDKDRWHVETCIYDQGSVLLTGDQGIYKMCRQLREKYGFPTEAMSVDEYLSGAPDVAKPLKRRLRSDTHGAGGGAGTRPVGESAVDKRNLG